MSDLLVPPVLDAVIVPTRNTDEGIVPQQHEQVAATIEAAGLSADGPEFEWRTAAARLLLIVARDESVEAVDTFLVQTQPDQPCLVTRLAEPKTGIRLPKLALANGQNKLLPIEGCEAELDELIVFGQALALKGLDRATKRLNPKLWFRTSPVTSVKYLR